MEQCKDTVQKRRRKGVDCYGVDAQSVHTSILIKKSESVGIRQPVHVAPPVANHFRIGRCVEELPDGVSHSFAYCLEGEGCNMVTFTASSWDVPIQKTPSAKAESVSCTSKQLSAAVLLEEPFGEDEGGWVPMPNGVDVAWKGSSMTSRSSRTERNLIHVLFEK